MYRHHQEPRADGNLVPSHHELNGTLSQLGCLPDNGVRAFMGFRGFMVRRLRVRVCSRASVGGIFQRGGEDDSKLTSRSFQTDEVTDG